MLNFDWLWALAVSLIYFLILPMWEVLTVSPSLTNTLCQTTVLNTCLITMSFAVFQLFWSFKRRLSLLLCRFSGFYLSLECLRVGTLFCGCVESNTKFSGSLIV